jgi:hypothetical protein
MLLSDAQFNTWHGCIETCLGVQRSLLLDTVFDGEWHVLEQTDQERRQHMLNWERCCYAGALQQDAELPSPGRRGHASWCWPGVLQQCPHLGFADSLLL